MIQLLLALLLMTAPVSPAMAVETGALNGTITNSSGEPAAGGEVYLYRTRNTRQPADFITPRTQSDGKYRIVLPAGIYWGVARVRAEGDERFGPLPLHQRHSGEPLQIEIEDGKETTLDFYVSTLREAAQKKEKPMNDLVTLTGTIVDRTGQPVKDAYAFARRDRDSTGIPEVISAWTESDGRFSLIVPPGPYFWGVSRTFPPPVMYHLSTFTATDRAELRLTLE